MSSFLLSHLLIPVSQEEGEKHSFTHSLEQCLWIFSVHAIKHARNLVKWKFWLNIGGVILKVCSSEQQHWYHQQCWNAKFLGLTWPTELESQRMDPSTQFYQAPQASLVYLRVWEWLPLRIFSREFPRTLGFAILWLDLALFSQYLVMENVGQRSYFRLLTGC